MSRAVEALVEAAGLTDLYDRVLREERLTFDDGVRLFESKALMAVGAMANIVRERKNGDAAYFVRNMHLNPTNVCTVDCKFCGFYRPYREKDQGWTWDLSRCLDEVRARLAEPLTEVHIVGGHNPDYPYEFYTDLIAGIRATRPEMHVKAFTAAEYDFFSKRFKQAARRDLRRVQGCGSGLAPRRRGGGARRARAPRDLSRRKSRPSAGSRSCAWPTSTACARTRPCSTATSRRLDERVEHLVRLRALQDETRRVHVLHPARVPSRRTPSWRTCRGQRASTI